MKNTVGQADRGTLESGRLDLSRILIIKPSSLGDVIQAVPVAWALRGLAPQARIDWLVTPGCAGVVESVGCIDHVVPFDRHRYGRMWWNPAALGSFAAFVLKLRRTGYTTVVDLQGLFRSGFLSWASGAATRIGLSDAREGAGRFYTTVVQVPAAPISAVDRYMLAAAALGTAADGPRRFDLTMAEDTAAEARRILADEGLKDGQRYVVLVPGARWPTKRWPEERFAELAKRIQNQLGLATVLIGGPEDREIAARVAQKAANLAGRTDLKTLAVVLRGAAGVITNDTGPMHLAAALGRPVVAIFGPTSAELAGPYGRGHVVLGGRVECAECYRRVCRWAGRPEELQCQQAISVDEVFAVVRKVLERGVK
jgi:lipopolysaccharide heptosyltransferase I